MSVMNNYVTNFVEHGGGGGRHRHEGITHQDSTDGEGGQDCTGLSLSPFTSVLNLWVTTQSWTNLLSF